MRTLPRVPARALFCWALFATFLCTVLLLGKSSFSEHSDSSSLIFSGNSGSSRGGRRKGTYVGNTGQFVFYHLPERNYTVDPETMALCKETTLTQCNPTPRRTEAEKAADRARRPPYKIGILRMPGFLSGDPDFSQCEYDNCKFIGTGSQYAKQADGFFVYVVGLRDKEFPLPKERRPDQTYFMGTWEAPHFTAADFLKNPRSPWNNAFNVTVTYRLDSDILFGYGKLDFQPPRPGKKPDYLQIAKQKTKTAVWIVSNCGSTNKRFEYVKEMQKYIDVDIFGKCGEPCEVFDEICIPDFVSTYRYYLSFENSYCTDYVTEKFFKLYIEGSHILPVVRGGLDYNKQFPEKAFVNAADFKSPKELALFLKDLEADDQRYSSYLEVKDRYRGIVYPDRFCQMCEYLHKNEGKTKILPDAKKWYKDGHCWDQTDI